MKSLKAKYEHAIRYRVYDQVVRDYQKIDPARFVLGALPYNYKCHLNAVQKVREGVAEKVVLCVAVRKKDWTDIIVHFINKRDDGTYQDNTWGWVHEEYSYYEVREVDPSEYSDVGTLLQSTQESLTKSNSSAFLRGLLGIGKSIL